MATVGHPGEVALAATGDVIKAGETHHVVEQEAAVPSVPVASSEAAPVPSKRAAKKAKKPKSEETVPVETDQNIAATIDHPYLSFLHKRIRLYKKKLEKIKALEAACANDGKVLNDQQQELVGSKALVEKMIAEFESLREQFIEVFVKEEEEKAKKKAVESVAPVKEQVVADAKEEPTIAKGVAPATELPRNAFAYVEDLLRTLHAVTLHQALGKDVPLVLDYFSKVVLGTTRPPAEVPFEENLAESLEEATRYLTQSEKIVALEFTYKDLRAMVEKLGAPAPSAVEDEGADQETASPDESSPIVEAPAAEALPHINFFTDSQIDVDAPVPADEEAIEIVTEDKEPEHGTPPEAIVSEEETPNAPSTDDETAQDAAPDAAPPKLFAAAATGSTAKNVWNRKPKSVTAPTSGSGDEKQNQRRRPQHRNKNNRSNSPRDSDGKNGEQSNGTATGSSNQNKQRRPRPQRSNDENSSSHNVNQPDSAGGKHDDRRPRSERPVRKPQHQQQRSREAAPV